MKKITGLTLAAMLMVSMLAGCSDNGRVDRSAERSDYRSNGAVERDLNGNSKNDNNPIERVGDAVGDVANGVGNAAGDLARGVGDAAGDLTGSNRTNNGEGMMIAGGSRIQDIVGRLGEEFGITMPDKLDETALRDLFGLDPADIEEYYGEYSAVNTSADHLIGIKAKPGKVEKVRKALEARRDEVVKNFSDYLPDQKDKASAGKIIEKGDYIFLIIAGDSGNGYDAGMNRAEEIINGYFK